MMNERPPTTPFQNPPQTTTFSFQRYTLVFQQHQDELIYDVWTRFKNLIQRVPYHDLNLWSLTQFFYDHVDNYTQMDLDFAAEGNLRELSGEEAWEAIENFTQGQKEWDNPPNIISEQEVENLKAQAKRLYRNENVWMEMHRDDPKKHYGFKPGLLGQSGSLSVDFSNLEVIFDEKKLGGS
ncbi:hypothetical protein Tco_1293486 [Tanacetum coccineum]